MKNHALIGTIEDRPGPVFGVKLWLQEGTAALNSSCLVSNPLPWSFKFSSATSFPAFVRGKVHNNKIIQHQI